VRLVDKITLDRETFKALASDTRLDILKALDVRQKTVTELAKELELNKATVFEHLEKLASVDLIQKLEDDRKWVYWQLTWRGRRLLHPETITLALALSSAAASLVTALVTFYVWLRSAVPRANAGPAAAPAPSPPPFGAASPRAQNTVAPGAAAPAPVAPPQPAHDPALLWIGVALALLCLALLAFGAWVWWRARRARARAAPPS
jgi:DNA-binding transcriptional ArsR family regulator